MAGCGTTDTGATVYGGVRANDPDTISKPGGRVLRSTQTGGVKAPAPVQHSGGIASDELRAGDFIKISLSGVPKEEQREDQFRVNDDGCITMPHLSPVKASGLTSGELERAIENQYKQKGIFSNPAVSVMVANRFVNVMGEVKQPQRVEYTNDMTVLGAISASGGFTDYADQSRVRVQRGGNVILVNCKHAIRDPDKDMPLKAGDTVEVRRSIF